jgi:hypothetical protein
LEQKKKKIFFFFPLLLPQTPCPSKQKKKMGSILSSCYAKLDSQSYGLSLFNDDKRPDITSIDDRWKISGIFDKANRSLYIKFATMKSADFTYTTANKQTSMMAEFGESSTFIQSIDCAERKFIPAATMSPTGEYMDLPNEYFGMWYFKFAANQQMPTADSIATFLALALSSFSWSVTVVMMMIVSLVVVFHFLMPHQCSEWLIQLVPIQHP